MSRYVYAAIVALFLALLMIAMNGCAYNSVTAYADGDVVVYCTTDKKTDVDADGTAKLK